MRLSGPVLTTATAIVVASFVAATSRQTIRDQQQLLQTTPNDLHNDGHRTFMPANSLASLSEMKYTTISHPAFPRHKVRMKKTSFCESSNSGYTGYIDIEARHIFFYFFESRRDPANDDVILWTNGGPGCSSAVGLLLGIGPCRIQDDGSLKPNPFAWNSHANVLFVDQPIGTGFSYAEHGESVGTTEEAAQDIAAFIAIFFENFTDLRGRALHMAGESYAGRYIPVFAAEIYDQNTRLVQAGITPVNLTSAIIGNGLTNPWTTMTSYYDMQCTNVAGGPILDVGHVQGDLLTFLSADIISRSCVQMKQMLPRCEKWAKVSCLDTFDAINCKAAFHFCFRELFEPILKTGLNPNNFNEECPPGSEDVLCYPIYRRIEHLLSQPEMLKQLGVDPEFSSFTSCSSTVEHAFGANMDAQHSSTLHLAALLERGIKVLSYVGDYDFICNSVGNERWTLGLDWTGQNEFRSQPLRHWTVDGRPMGVTRSARGLTYATVHGAGHMVPYDKPKEAWVLIGRWIAGEDV